MASRKPIEAPAPRALSEVSTESILESISDGVFTVDAAWRVTSFNRAAEQITGVSRADALGCRCSEVFRASMCESECALRQTLETGTPVVNRTAFIVDGQGRRIPVSVSTALLRDRFGKVVGGAETFRDLTVIEELRKEIQGRFRIGDICSRSDAMRRVLEIVPLLAESESTVLIQGATGTGKELVARAIHGQSPRRAKPFVAVNCGALPDSLLESELFGYPGNVRELHNVIEHAFVLRHEGVIELRHLPGHLVPVVRGGGGTRPLQASVQAVEAQAIRDALERCGNNRTVAARELGMHKSTLFRKARALGLTLPDEDGRSRPHDRRGS